MKLSQRLSLLLAGSIVLGLVAPITPASAASSPSALPLISIADEGGFVPPSFQVANLPRFAAFQEPKSKFATLLVRNDVSTLPNAGQMLRSRVDSTRLMDYIIAVYKAAKTPTGGWGTPGVADVPNTRIVIHASNLHKNLSIYALGFTNGSGVSSTQAKSRVALTNAIGKLQSWIKKFKSSPYKPASYELWIHSEVIDSGGLGIANPASIFCTSMYGKIEIVTSPDGEQGICVLPDGHRIDEWAFFQKESPKLAAWPTGVTLPKFAPPGGGCVAVSFAKLSQLLAASRKPGPALLPSGQAMPFSLRPVLPSERACKRFG